MVSRARRSSPLRWKVRRASLSDLDVLVQNRRLMWEDIAEPGELGPGLLDRADRRYRAWARPRIKNGTLIGFLAEGRDGAVLGSGAIWLQPIHPRPWWPHETIPYLMAMYTRREARGQGVASAVVRAALAWSKAAGYPRVVLHASDMGKSVYAKLGFERSWEMRYLFYDRSSRMQGHLKARRRTARGRTFSSTARRASGRAPGASSFR